MTENEALKLVDRMVVSRKCEIIKTLELKAVILNALEEIQQYLAIGTVEQLEWCKDASHWKGLYKEKLEQYEAIGTVEEFKDLKEKNEPKKPLRATLGRDMACHCPICMNFVCFADTHKSNYCPTCGQKLDWETEC